MTDKLGLPTAQWEKGNFLGHGVCEHRTTGGRAWCYNCEEWCYPNEPCVRCKEPLTRALLVEALEVIEDMEARAFSGNIYCPTCGKCACPDHGHTPDCKLAALMGRLKEAIG